MKLNIDPLDTAAIWGLADLAPALEIYPDEDFDNTEGETVLAGSVDRGDFRYRVVGVVEDNIATFPAIQNIDSTEDSLTNQRATYSAYIRVKDRPPYPLLLRFPIAPLTDLQSSVSWTRLKIHAQRGVSARRSSDEAYTKQQTENAIAAAIAALPLPEEPSIPEIPDDYHIRPEDFGAVGDGVTDDTEAFQAAIDAADAAGGGSILLGPKTYIIAGPLQDPLFSNSQLVLPKRNPATQSQIALRFVGMGAPIPFPHANGTIVRSTLDNGNGAMVSVKCNFGAGTGSQAEIVANHRSAVSFESENITWRMVSNPTNSCFDLRFIPHYRFSGETLIDVDGIGLNAGSVTVPEPTTPTSYGLISPVDFCSSANVIDGHMLILGYYNGIALGELVHGVNVEVAAVKVAVELRGGSHANHFDKLLIVSAATLLKTTGQDPVFAPVPGPINTCLINIDQLDFENGGSPVWTGTNPGSHLSDVNNYLSGDITWSSTLWEFTKTGGVNCKTHPLAKPWHSVRPFTNVTGADLDLSNHAVDETYRGLQVADSSAAAWKLLTNHQSGLNHLVGVLAFVNDAIANGNLKALAWLTAVTAGAINSGMVSLDIMNAGVMLPKAKWDRFGNYSIAGFLVPAQGATLTIVGGVITPIFSLHTVQGAGPLTTITLPAGVTEFGAAASCIIDLIPAADWPYDNSGNILGAGTALANKKIQATWLPNISKWAMSY